MIPSSAKAAFANIRPEGGADIDAARPNDRARVACMLATDPADWSDENIDFVAFRAMTTLGGPQTVKWILPAYLARSSANPAYGWMTDSDVVVSKLDGAEFDAWPNDQRAAMLGMLSDWLKAQEAAFPDDYVPYNPEDDAILRGWLKART